MPPKRIMFIRHAEKPEPGSEQAGVGLHGLLDDESSLTIRGWQRAGGLARFFCPLPEGVKSDRAPTIIYAARPAQHGKSKRPLETVMPLHFLLNEEVDTPLNSSFERDEGAAMMADVLQREGTVLISWEHKRIPELIAMLPNAPLTPQKWSGKRYDIVWVVDRQGDGWTFDQWPQMLLSGDRPDPIKFKTAPVVDDGGSHKDTPADLITAK